MRASSTASLFTPEHTGTPVGTEPKVRVFNKREGGSRSCGKRRVQSSKASRSSRLSVGENSLPAPTSQHIHVDCGGGGGSSSPRTGPTYRPRIPFVPLWIKESRSVADVPECILGGDVHPRFVRPECVLALGCVELTNAVTLLLVEAKV